MKSFAFALAAGVAAADSFTGEKGNTLTSLVDSSYVRIRATMVDKKVTVTVEQNFVATDKFSSAEQGEMFVCFARKTTKSDECIVTSWLATNPGSGVYTIKNSAYTKTIAKPSLNDFTTDKSFISGTKGFEAGADFVLKYAQHGSVTKAGASAVPSAATKSATGYSYKGGNTVDKDQKTIRSELEAVTDEKDAAAAKELLAIIK